MSHCFSFIRQDLYKLRHLGLSVEVLKSGYFEPTVQRQVEVNAASATVPEAEGCGECCCCRRASNTGVMSPEATGLHSTM